MGFPPRYPIYPIAVALGKQEALSLHAKQLAERATDRSWNPPWLTSNPSRADEESLMLSEFERARA
jgi:hypothetical protein